MQSVSMETSFTEKKEGSGYAKKNDDIDSAASLHGMKDLIDEPVVVSVKEKNRIPDSVDEDDESCNASEQLVLYGPKENGSHEMASNSDPVTDNHNGSVSKELVLYDPIASVVSPNDPPHCQLPVLAGCASNITPSKIIPSVGAYTVQCANCFKWRLIPSKRKYEEIREHILDQPFVCDTAREWQPEISCEEPPDIQQDDSRVWAIDKPNISQPPPGWERELRIRGEGGSRFADVYYIAPGGKKLRSMVEVQKYLLEPEHIQEGLIISQFSFQIPKPLQENYVKKRARVATSPNDLTLTPSMPFEFNEASPLSLPASADSTVFRHTDSGPSDTYSPETLPSSDARPLKQQNSIQSPPPSNERLHNRIKIKLGNTRPPTNTNEAL